MTATWTGDLHDSKYHTREVGRVIEVQIKAEFETVYRAHGTFFSSYSSIDRAELEPVKWQIIYKGRDVTEKLNPELLAHAEDIINDYTCGHCGGWS